jgi:hypothetical protein
MKGARPKKTRWVPFAAVFVSLSGCGGTEVKLADVPPAKIAPSKDSPVSKNPTALQSGAPPTGSSSGIRHNPSETPRPPAR